MQQNTHEQQSLEGKKWRIQFENIEDYGSTGSEMKPFLVKLSRILNCWTCFIFLPCASPFAGGLGAGLGLVLGRNLGINCGYHVCKLLIVWARDGILVGQFPFINFGAYWGVWGGRGDGGDVGATSRSQRAPHMRVRVCTGSNARQFTHDSKKIQPFFYHTICNPPLAWFVNISSSTGWAHKDSNNPPPPLALAPGKSEKRRSDRVLVLARDVRYQPSQAENHMKLKITSKQTAVGCSTPPPPLSKLRQSTKLIRSLRLLWLRHGRSLDKGGGGTKRNVVMSRTHLKHDTAPVSLYIWHTITFC